MILFSIFYVLPCVTILLVALLGLVVFKIPKIFAVLLALIAIIPGINSAVFILLVWFGEKAFNSLRKK